ncbi:MAG: M28 family peptidase, partial [Candidatus Kariarchaeaceae archaeon]
MKLYNRKIIFLISFFIFSLLIVQINTVYLAIQSDSDESLLDLSTPTDLVQDFIDFQNLDQSINETYFENIQSHIENLSSFGSRYTGYSGYKEAATYIKSFFQFIPRMESIESVPYEVTVPIEQETFLQIGNTNYSAYTLLPNSVHTGQTPQGGVSGSLIYGGSGQYSDLDGKKVNGSIVVLEFNSGDNWINAASLGAKGVIFLAPNDSNRFEAEQKIIDVPLYFPRIYVTNTTSNIIKQFALQNNLTSNIFSNMQWKTIEAENIVGIYPGTSNDKVIISAYYDSTSIIPSLSPGADEANGISTLLELIRYMDDNDIIPQKSIMFLALSGHNQAAAGAREFVQQNYELLNIDSGIKLFLSLDLSATNNKIGITSYSHLYKFKLQFTSGNNLINRIKELAGIFENYANEIQEKTNNSFDVKPVVNNQNFEDIAPIVYFGDQEPFVASNTLGLSFFTAETHRLRFNTPFDLIQNLNMEYLESQVVYTFGSLIQLMTKENLDSILDLQHKGFSLRHNTHVGFGSIQGNVKEFDERTAWLANVPNAIVKITSFDTRSATYGEYSYVTKADSTGFYEVNGIASSQPDSPLEFRVEAYHFDSDGLLTKAINLGSRGQIFKNIGTLTSKITSVNPTVFDSGTLAFFEVTHPYNQAPSAENLIYQVLDPVTRSELFSYGYIGQKTVSLAFLPHNTPSVMVGTLPDGVVAVYATNSNEIEKKGRGFQLDKGDFKNLGISAFLSTKDLLSITQTYIDLYTSYNIYDALVDDAYQRASVIINTANLLKSNYNYSISIGSIKQGQTWAYDSFSGSRGVITDGTSSTIFFAILLIPFSFALTSLLFTFESGKNKIIVTSAVFGLILFFFYLIHPGLHLSSNIGMIIIGVIAAIFVFPALMM